MHIITSWSKRGEPVGTAAETVYVPKEALRVNERGTVYLYVTIPVIVTNEDGRGVVKTTAAGSLILRAAPVLD